MIEISENPVTIINGISYFLLSAKSCQLDTLKILYMLSQSIYINTSLISQLELNIDKAVDLEQSWDIHNFLYLVGSPIDASSGLQTMADTKQLNGGSHMNPSQMMGEQGCWLASNHLLNYFSETNNVQYKNSILDMDLIRTNIKNEYDPFTTRAYTYQTILQSCGIHLFDNKPLSISKFHELNASIISQQLYNQAIINYQLFSINMIDSLKNYKHLYQSLKSQILQPFTQWEMTWLSRLPSFTTKKQQIVAKVQKQFQRIKSISHIKAEKSQISFLNQHIKQKNICDSLGNPKLNREKISFTIYNEFMRDKIYGLIETLTSPEWRGQNKPITTGNDLLANLQTRIEINQKKKVGLQEGVKLAQKQKEYLSQLVFAYISKINPFQIIT